MGVDFSDLDRLREAVKPTPPPGGFSSIYEAKSFWSKVKGIAHHWSEGEVETVAILGGAKECIQSGTAQTSEKTKVSPQTTATKKKTTPQTPNQNQTNRASSLAGLLHDVN
jgi:replication initiation and membrane attachment protein DnaB